MRVKAIAIYTLTSLALLPMTGFSQNLTPIEQLGKDIFFDKGLSSNGNQSCASCHAPEAGWTGPISETNVAGAVYEGSILGRFGNRKPPSAAYATLSPILHLTFEQQNNKNKVSALFIGGNFWDGRATGERLGSPSAEQALGPFLNSLEQALGSPSEVIGKICSSDYQELFNQVCQVDGVGACSVNAAHVSDMYDCVGKSIAAYEGSTEVNQFSSKYDAYLQGQVDLAKQEKQGLNLFKGKGKCSACHVLDPGSDGNPALLTDYTYDNLGIPRNPANPFYTEFDVNPNGNSWVDRGLGGFLAAPDDSRADYRDYAAENYGKQKVPTLRNVAKGSCENGNAAGCIVKAYGHNGYFKSLWQIVHFYNTRDAKSLCTSDLTAEQAIYQGCWPAPEVAVNVNTSELGNLHLTLDQEEAIVAFLKTLSDGYTP